MAMAMRRFWGWIRKVISLDEFGLPLLLLCVLLVMVIWVYYYSQKLSEETSLPPIVTTSTKEQYEIAKLAAEIRQIRSDTSGSLFWLRMIALIVTVAGAVSGYLAGQRQTTKKRIEFEHLKNIDSTYQGFVLELADQSPLLRAAAAVRLGMLLKSFPSEWDIDDERKRQKILLTKLVLAASLAIETDPKVLKTLTIALVMHKPWENDPKAAAKQNFADARELDLSKAKARDAYWKRVDFSGSDFWGADLTKTSFRESLLEYTQFSPAGLHRSVFVKAICRGTNFRMADLRDADLSEATCEETNFELADLRGAVLSNATFVKSRFAGAKVFGCVMSGAKFDQKPDVLVDDTKNGDGSHMIRLTDWLASQSAAST